MSVNVIKRAYLSLWVLCAAFWSIWVLNIIFGSHLYFCQEKFCDGMKLAMVYLLLPFAILDVVLVSLILGKIFLSKRFSRLEVILFLMSNVSISYFIYDFPRS